MIPASFKFEKLLSFRLKHEEDVYVKYLLTEMCSDNII